MWDISAIFLSNVYTWWICAAVFALIGAIKRKKRFLQIGLLLIASMGISDLISARALKPFVERARPCRQLSDVRAIAGCSGTNGFPSNHASNAMAATAILFAIGARRWAVCLFIISLLVGWSRLYLGVHFPSDVLAGFGVGALVSYALFLILKNRFQLRLSD